MTAATDTVPSNQNRETVLELSNIKVEFKASPSERKSHVVLNQISLSLKKGECMALIGPSGHGKTVLLKTMAGLIDPNEGQVKVYGKNWMTLGKRDREILLQRIGMLFQKNALFDSLTCGENIAFPLRERTTLSSSEINSQVEYFLEAVGIPHAKNLFPDEISGGMQKRLGIARALALNPEILFYDDPTAGLDPITSRKIVDLIVELQKKNQSTFIAITNDMNRAYQMSDRILMVVDQHVLDAGTPQTIKNNSDPRVIQFINGELKGPLTVIA